MEKSKLIVVLWNITLHWREGPTLRNLETEVVVLLKQEVYVWNLVECWKQEEPRLA